MTVRAPVLATWVRSDWWRRRASLLLLALTIGLLAGAVTAAAAGARRTSTSLERLAVASRSADVRVDMGSAGLPEVRRMAALPSVSKAASVTIVYAMVDGVSIDLGLFLPRGDALRAGIERDRLLRGARVEPGRTDQVTINEPMARLTGLDAGDHIVIHTLTPQQVKAEEYFPPKGPDVPVTITGVTRGPSDLTAVPQASIFADTALYPKLAGKVDEFALYAAVKLAPDATFGEFKREVRPLQPTEGDFDLQTFADVTAPARRTISTLAIGLAVLAGVAGIAVAVSIVQTTSRHVEGAGVDDVALGALGLTRRQREQALGATILPAVLIAPVVAVLVAVLLSPLTPIGLARRAEPDPGVRLDVPVLLIGALATALVIALSAFVAGMRVTRARDDERTGRPSSAATAAGRAGAPAPVVHGVALAFDRGPGRGSSRSTLVALGVAVIVAVGSLTFAASLVRLRDTSDRWGSPWDLSLDFTSDRVDQAAEQLANDRGLATVTRWDSGATLADGEYVRAYGAESLRGNLAFSLVRGDQPGPGEVVVGPETASRHHLELGDVVQLSSPEKPEERADLRVVGIGLFPEIDDGDFVDGIGLTARDFAARASVPDLFEASNVVVSVAPGASVDATESRLRKTYGDESVSDARPVRPGAVTNLVGLSSVTRLLLGLAALLCVVALAHAVRSTAERRAADFATLRAIGMTRRQRWTCSLSQSIALTVAALLVGLPLGVVAGRAIWAAVARSIDVAPEPLAPVLGCALVALVTLVAAVLATATVRPSTRPPRYVEP